MSHVASIKSPHANKGRALEEAVIASQLNIICVAKIPSGMRYTGGGEKIDLPNGKSRFLPRTVAVKSPCDFLGCIVTTGQAIAFDAKSCALVKGFRVDHDDHFPAHQRQFLIRMGRAGAVSGAVVEATEIRKFLWLDWRYFTPRAGTPWPVIPWTDPAWFDLGPSSNAIRFADLAASEWVDEPAVKTSLF